MSPYTVLGASGFIGARLVAYLRRRGLDCLTPDRDDPLPARPGHIIYCIGLTADFRSRPWDTLEAHVCRLVELLRGGQFESLLYLSSTRVYQRLPADQPAREDMALYTDPRDPSDLYNLSKLAGEAACLAHPNPQVRVVRLSNVYGVGCQNFLGTILEQALTRSRVELHSALGSAKDYIAVEDVVEGLYAIASRGRQRLYNLAAGHNTSHATLARALERLLDCQVTVAADAPPLVFPVIAIDRLRREFDLQPRRLEAVLPELVQQYRRQSNRP